MNPLSRIPYDKALHFIAGSIVSAFAPAIGDSLLLPVALAAVAGVGKEIYDSFHRDRHTVDPLDFVATTAGALPVTLAIALPLLGEYCLASI